MKEVEDDGGWKTKCNLCSAKLGHSYDVHESDRSFGITHYYLEVVETDTSYFKEIFPP